MPRARGRVASIHEWRRETVRKGFRIAARASILAPHSSEIGLFRPFRGLLRLQFGARGDFSDSLRRGLPGNSVADNKGFSETGVSFMFIPGTPVGMKGAGV